MLSLDLRLKSTTWTYAEEARSVVDYALVEQCLCTRKLPPAVEGSLSAAVT